MTVVDEQGAIAGAEQFASEATVAAENVEQAKAWDGGEGANWTEHELQYDNAVRRHHARLMDAAGIAAHEHVLDIGCGNGASTRDAARLAPDGTALGIDLSGQMIARARERARAEGLMNVRFEQGDAQIHPFAPASFDVAISRFGAMFIGDQVAAFGNIGRALRPAGRLVMVSWREMRRNEWISSFKDTFAAGRPIPDAPAGSQGPFGHADPDKTRADLTAAGFTDVGFDEVNESMFFGADAEDAYRFLSRGLAWMADGLDEEAKAKVFHDLRALLAAHDTGDGVWFESAAWLITARRR